MTCDTFERRATAWLAGDVDPDGTEPLEDHASGCPRCREHWRQLRPLVTALEAPVIGPARRERLAVQAARERLRAAFADAGLPPIRFSSVASRFGSIFLGLSDRGLCDVSIDTDEASYRTRVGRWSPEAQRDDAALRPVRDELRAYLSGRLQTFSFPVDLRRSTPFVARVLEAVRRIPFGQVSSYRELAASLRQPRAARAIGGALGRNPIPIAIPCHRIVRASGELGGYVWGQRVKARLLALEGHPAEHRVVERS